LAVRIRKEAEAQLREFLDLHQGRGDRWLLIKACKAAAAKENDHALQGLRQREFALNVDRRGAGPPDRHGVPLENQKKTAWKWDPGAEKRDTTAPIRTLG